MRKSKLKRHQFIFTYKKGRLRSLLFDVFIKMSRITNEERLRNLLTQVVAERILGQIEVAKRNG